HDQLLPDRFRLGSLADVHEARGTGPGPGGNRGRVRKRLAPRQPAEPVEDLPGGVLEGSPVVGDHQVAHVETGAVLDPSPHGLQLFEPAGDRLGPQPFLDRIGWGAGTAWTLGRFVTGRDVFHRLERWQASYLPALALWAGLVVVALPPLISFA